MHGAVPSMVVLPFYRIRKANLQDLAVHSRGDIVNGSFRFLIHNGYEVNGLLSRMKERIITTGKHRMLFMNLTVILPINKRKEGEEKCMTKEDIPLEAAEIEIKIRTNLETCTDKREEEAEHTRKRMLIADGVLATSKEMESFTESLGEICMLPFGKEGTIYSIGN